MSNEAPTDALRLEAAKIIDPAAFLFQADELMKGDTSQHDALRKAERILALAAPASPLPGGGPTCQLCANKIEGWICQGCGSHFYENDAGALVLNTIPAAPTGDA